MPELRHQCHFCEQFGTDDALTVVPSQGRAYYVHRRCPMPFEIVAWQQLQEVSLTMDRWRCYAADALETTEAQGAFGTIVYQRQLTGWWAEGSSARQVMQDAAANGPGRYLVAGFKARPFGGYKGTVATIIEVSPGRGISIPGGVASLR